MNSLVLLAVSAGIGLGVLAVAGTYIANLCNRLVAASQRAINGFSQMEVQLKRRHDLVLRLIDATGGHLVQEPTTLESVIEARDHASETLRSTGRTASELQAIANAEATLGGALADFLIGLDDDPELKENETVATLLDELTSTENRISFARQLFNDFVVQFNRIRNQFPTSVVSSPLGYRDDMSPLRYGEVAPLSRAPYRERAGQELVGV